MADRVRALLSLCQKAGLLASGEFACEKALQNGGARLVVLAGDSSALTKEKFEKKALYYNVPSVVYGDKSSLGAAIGKEERAVVVVTDKGLSLKIKEALDMV